jgi:catechol 2,3-dioxygenase-like lactoylglutathione lyase family enzyme
MTIKSVHHSQITIPPGTEEKARLFYCKILGLKEIPKPDALQNHGGFWLELNGFQIHIGTEDNLDRTKTKAHLAYLVEDLDNWQKKLEDEGVPVKQGISISYFERFEFRDPFGNRVEFLEKV